MGRITHQNGLTDALLDLAKMVEEMRKELGFEQEADKCSLNGSLVPFILGITATQPDSATYVPDIFTEHLPLQVTIAFDNEIRNQAVKWMEANGYEISSYLGQPLLKLKNVRIVIRMITEPSPDYLGFMSQYYALKKLLRILGIDKQLLLSAKHESQF